MKTFKKILKGIYAVLHTILSLLRKLLAACIIGILICCIIAGVFLYKNSETIFGTSIQSIYEDAKFKIAASTEDDFVLNQTSYIYDANGDLMTKLSVGESQNYVEYKNIPENVINAMVAVEDKSFWDNPGFDITAIVRAGLSYIQKGEITQGGSTITQQLVKLVYLSSDQTLSRKANEIMLAYFVTQKYEKEQILEWYINQCCFANGIYGISDAAYAYLGKTLDELTLAETAYLCSIPNSPEYYNPWVYPENAVERMKLILQDMYEEGYITAEEYKEALNSSIDIQHNTTESDYDDSISYAVYCATEYIMELNGFSFQNEFYTDEEYESYWSAYNEAYSEAKDMLYTGGYQIYTSLQPDTQEVIQGYLDEGLSFNADLTEDGIYNLQGSVTVVDNTTNKVVAIVGGRTQENVNYGINRAFQSTRQPGSSIKPLLVYGPAVDNGYTKESTLYNIDVQSAYEAYADRNKSVDDLTGTAYSLGTAVQWSYNGCAVYLYNKITPSVGLSYVYQLGLNHLTKDDQYLAAGLGGLTYGTNTLEMAGAYSVFPSFGEYTKPDCLISVLDETGNELYYQTESVQVFERNTAIQMAEILEAPIRSGTAKSMKWYSYSDVIAAGKTGTTQKSADGWFCGFTDQYTIAVWVGSDDNTTVSGMQGGTYPATIWRDSMLWVLENKAVEVESSIFDAELESTDTVISNLTEEEIAVLAESGEVWYANQAGNVRSGPGTDYESLFICPQGAAVTILEMRQYWTQIYYEGQTGWIYTPFLSAYTNEG